FESPGHYQYKMRVIGSILLLLANAVTCRREKRPLFNRVAVLISPILGTLAYDSYGISLARVTGILSGIFHSTLITHSFDINLYAIGDVIFNPIQNDLLALSMIFFLLLLAKPNLRRKSTKMLIMIKLTL